MKTILDVLTFQDPEYLYAYEVHALFKD